MRTAILGLYVQFHGGDEGEDSQEMAKARELFCGAFRPRERAAWGADRLPRSERMKGNRSAALVVVAVTALAFWGCANPLNEADTVGTGFVPAPQGADVCYQCHASDIFV